QAANCLSEMEQSPEPSILDSIQSFLNAIAKKELLTHQDRDVKVLVATCACEATRITAPEAPYSDDVLRVSILLSCVVMLDLECNDLIHEMFRTFVSVVTAKDFVPYDTWSPVA
ncbi:hypothetical protein BHE74_00033777, partial [Ensete ventricosum]